MHDLHYWNLQTIDGRAAVRSRCSRRVVRYVLPVALILSFSYWLPAYGRGVRRKGDQLIGRVVEVTEQRVYVNMGTVHGLRKGDALTISLPGRKHLNLPVSAVSRRSAVAELANGAVLPQRGALVRAKWRRTERPKKMAKAKPAPRPESLETMESRWRGVDRKLPYVPRPRVLGPDQRVAKSTPVHGTLRFEYLGLLNLRSTTQENFHQVALYSDLEVPRLWIDGLDYAHRFRLRWQMAKDRDSRPFRDSRAVPLVYQARLGLTRGRFRAELGRTVGAALPDVGMIDGANVRVRLARSVYVGGFGGMAPRPDDLRPTTDASQFGAYTALRWASPGRSRAPWSVAIDTGVVGSTWQGAVDRKALTTRAVFDSDHFSIDSQAVLDLYGSDHPLHRPTVDLSLLGVGAELRATRWLAAGVRFDRYRFVPTREILATFPQDFLDQPAANSLRGFVDLRLGKTWSLGGQGGWDFAGGETWAGWGELTMRAGGLLGDDDSLQLAALVNQGNLLDGYGGRIAYVRSILDSWSISASYGLHRDSYHHAVGGSSWRHYGSAGTDVFLGRHWSAGAVAQLQLSDQERVLEVFSNAAAHF